MSEWILNEVMYWNECDTDNMYKETNKLNEKNKSTYSVNATNINAT